MTWSHHALIGSLNNHDDDGDRNVTNSSFARFARIIFTFMHLAAFFALWTKWNNLFCSCVDDISTWPQTFIFRLFSFPNRLDQFDSMIFNKPNDFKKIEEWLQKREIKFSDDILAVVDVVFV